MWGEYVWGITKSIWRIELATATIRGTFCDKWCRFHCRFLLWGSSGLYLGNDKPVSLSVLWEHRVSDSELLVLSLDRICKAVVSRMFCITLTEEVCITRTVVHWVTHTCIHEAVCVCTHLFSTRVHQCLHRSVNTAVRPAEATLVILICIDFIQILRFS